MRFQHTQDLAGRSLCVRQIRIAAGSYVREVVEGYRDGTALWIGLGE